MQMEENLEVSAKWSSGLILNQDNLTGSSPAISTNLLLIDIRASRSGKDTPSNHMDEAFGRFGSNPIQVSCNFKEA